MTSSTPAAQGSDAEIARIASGLSESDRLALAYIAENPNGVAMPSTAGMADALARLGHVAKHHPLDLVRQGRGGAGDPHNLGTGVYYLTDLGRAVAQHLKGEE